MFVKAFIPYFYMAVKTFIDKTDFVKRFSDTKKSIVETMLYERSKMNK